MEWKGMKITGLSNQICTEIQKRLFKLDRNSKEYLAFFFLSLTEIQKSLLLFFSIDWNRCEVLHIMTYDSKSFF